MSVKKRESSNFSSSGMGRPFVRGDLRPRRVFLTGVEVCAVELRTQHPVRVQEVDCRHSRLFCAFIIGSRTRRLHDNPKQDYKAIGWYSNRSPRADYEG